jgi:hypothetical protein
MKYVLGDGANHMFRVDLPSAQIPGCWRRRRDGEEAGG